MASAAFKDFEYNIMDAKRLVQAHRVLAQG